MLNSQTLANSDYREQLLGFDARVLPATAYALWRRARRRKHITGRYVTVPISIDPFIWHSVFDHGIGLGMSPGDRLNVGYSGLSRPKWIGPNNLWERPDFPFSSLGDDYREGRDYCVAAFTVLRNEATQLPGLYSVGTELPHGISWIPLGCDVASFDMTSALVNYQFEPSELRQIKERWGRLLNRFNLFEDFRAALTYAEKMNTSKPTEAPFYRFGIYIADFHRCNRC
jgi:hypothetical protein